MHCTMPDSYTLILCNSVSESVRTDGIPCQCVIHCSRHCRNNNNDTQKELHKTVLQSVAESDCSFTICKCSHHLKMSLTVQMSKDNLPYLEKSNSPFTTMDKATLARNILWRERDSDPRPLGYEPNELPLLHPAE